MKNKVLLVIAIFTTLLLSSAAAYYYFTVPQNVRVTNVTSSAAVVSWTTRAPLRGKVRYNQVNHNYLSKLEEDRKYNHYVELVDLEEDSIYEFMPGTKFFSYRIKGIMSEDFTVTEEKAEFKTYKVLDNPIIPSFIYGSAVCDTEECYDNSVVYLKVDGLTPISTTVNETGGWSIDLSSARDEETGGTPIISNSLDKSELYVEAGRFGNSEIITEQNLTLGKKVEKNLVVKER